MWLWWENFFPRICLLRQCLRLHISQIISKLASTYLRDKIQFACLTVDVNFITTIDVSISNLKMDIDILAQAFVDQKKKKKSHKTFEKFSRDMVENTPTHHLFFSPSSPPLSLTSPLPLCLLSKANSIFISPARRQAVARATTLKRHASASHLAPLCRLTVKRKASALCARCSTRVCFPVGLALRCQ